MSLMIPRPMNVGIQEGSLFLSRQSVAVGERDADPGVGTVRSPVVANFSFTGAILVEPMFRLLREFYVNEHLGGTVRWVNGGWLEQNVRMGKLSTPPSQWSEKLRAHLSYFKDRPTTIARKEVEV